MTAKEWLELQAFYHIEPFGEWKKELRHGQEMAFHHNLNRDEKRRPEAFTALEFMNFVVEPPEKIYTPEELQAYADRIFGT